MNAFWIAQLRKDFLWAYSYKISFFGQFFGILITVFTFFFLSETFSMSQSPHLKQYGNNYFLFAIIGMSIVDFISTCLRSATKSIREAQAFGYIDMVLNAKISPQYFIISSLIYPCCIGLVRVSLYLLVAYLFRAFDLSLLTIIYAVLLSILTLLPFIGIGLLAASYVIAFKQGDPVNFFINILMTAFSGVLFPVSVLPEVLQYFSSILPITYGLDLIRKVIIFNSPDYVSLAIILYLLLSAAVLFAVGVFASVRTIAVVKLSGTSGRY
jgi:ABC-2 type transport system permease protein